jgi:non-ribosomal peptide synthetase component F
MELLSLYMDKEVSTQLRLIMMSGDWIPLSLFEKIEACFPEADVYSLGGATEASIWSIYYKLEFP